jgi:hypothetical protein
MQNKSIRIRTNVGVDKNINVELNQDFDFIEILSLKLTQEDLYETFCADYGVLVGRVIANRGFGVPNAKVSVFIPISSEDERNNLIQELYPFKTVTTKDDDGFRYNLLLSETTCNLNTATGSFPTKEDILTNEIELEIFDKYYKYTTKTNQAGDYIIFGAPIGQQTIHVDVDLSDIGLLSLRPYELIEQGFSEKQFDGITKFRSSNNLDELPQIKTQNKGVDIVPFWGDPERCSFGITRVDFDTGVDIIPSSVFIGSVFTDTKKNALSQRCNPKNDMGEQCELTTKAGTIDILRLNYDEVGNPQSIEEFTPRAGRDLIDDDGTFTFNLPMYYDRVVTDEFGNLVRSTDPEIGVPTKGKYRFKLKFNEGGSFKNRTTANLLVPSLHRNHGGSEGTEQQRWTSDITQYDDSNVGNIGASFGGSQPPQPPQPTDQPKPKTVSTDLDLDFHTFEWKQVYTISHFIKKYKRGNNRLSFIGIKGCDECDYNNYFPFTTAIKKASFNFFLQSLFIRFIATILKILIQIGNVRFCASYKLTGGSRCRRISNGLLFPFIINGLNAAFPGGLSLPCEPEDYSINTFICEDSTCETCSNCGGDPIKYKNADNNGLNGNGDSSDPCCRRTNGQCRSCGSGGCVGIAFIAPDEQDCAILNQLEQWKCCAILQSARQNGAIKFSFFDAWLNGSAYLFQAKAKRKFKNDGTTKDKFCGPGSDNLGGDNYAGYNAFSNFFGNGDYDGNTCSGGQCLILGPSIDNGDRNYVGGVQGGTPEIRVPTNSPGIPNGANDINDFIYCNWVSSTKVVGLGRIQMCEDVYRDIKDCIVTNTNHITDPTASDCSISDLRLGDTINPYTGDNLGPLSPYNIPTAALGTHNPPQVIKVGTGGESGFDRSETIEKLDETSYQDPSVVLIYLLSTQNCDFGDLFYNPGENPGGQCHELELYEEFQEQTREVCKIQNDVVTVPPIINGQPDFDAVEVWDIAGQAPIILNDANETPGPFAIDELLRDRYHPNPDNDTTNNPESIQFYVNPHIDPKTNMPYFYFGLNPGKTAIDKFRKKYLV